MRREETFPDRKCLNISSLQTDYLNLDNSASGPSRHNQRAHSVQTKCTFCGLNNHSAEKCFKRIRQEKEKARAIGVSYNRNSERTPCKFYRCGYEGHMIVKCPKPPKDNEKQRKQVLFIEKGNCACDNGKDKDDHKIYAYGTLIPNPKSNWSITNCHPSMMYSSMSPPSMRLHR